MNSFLELTINKILDLSEETIKQFPKEKFMLNYLAVYTKKLTEFEILQYEILDRGGKELTKFTTETSTTFKLKNPINTRYGKLALIKLRHPDKTRPQLGAPDFNVKSYENFKQKYVKNNSDISVIHNDKFEMLEIKGADVLVYILNKPLNI